LVGDMLMNIDLGLHFPLSCLTGSRFRAASWGQKDRASSAPIKRRA